MAVEPTEFNVFGIQVKQEDLINIRSATAETYNSLMKKAERWTDSEFCKRQIVSLWDGIQDMLWRLSEQDVQIITPRMIRTVLTTDGDNQEFLTALGDELRRKGTMSSILKQLDELSVESGSLRIRFNDSLANKTAEAWVEVDKLLSRIERERSKIVNGLRRFIDWVKDNKRPIITCSLIAGVIVTSIVAACYAGIPVLSLKLLVMASLAIVCLIYEAYGASETLNRTQKALARRLGLHL